MATRSTRTPPRGGGTRTIRKTPATRHRSGAASASAALAPRRLPLTSLRVFVAVGEHLSFSRAADALGVGTSAASMQVQALEDYLRVPLFRRNGRLVALTPEGAALLPRVRSALAALESAVDDARADRDAGPLRLSMVPSFLNQWLLPRLADLHARHPGIDLHFDTSITPVDFVQTGMHAAIRLMPDAPHGLHADDLFDEWLVPVAQPALLARLGPVHEAADLTRYRLLHSLTEPWSTWLLGAHQRDDWPATGVAFDDSVALLRAAESGHGLALGRWSLAQADIAAGKLALASSKVVVYSRRYRFVCPSANLRMQKVAVFREWLLAQGKAFPRPPGVR